MRNVTNAMWLPDGGEGRRGPDLEEAVEVDGEALGSEEPRRTQDASYPSGGATEVAPA
jgi:hypothetical protein